MAPCPRASAFSAPALPCLAMPRCRLIGTISCVSNWVDTEDLPSHSNILLALQGTSVGPVRPRQRPRAPAGLMMGETTTDVIREAR
jgi:hypothetical protein